MDEKYTPIYHKEITFGELKGAYFPDTLCVALSAIHAEAIRVEAAKMLALGMKIVYLDPKADTSILEDAFLEYLE